MKFIEELCWPGPDAGSFGLSLSINDQQAVRCREFPSAASEKQRYFQDLG